MKSSRLVAVAVSMAMILTALACTSEDSHSPSFIYFQSRGGDSFERTEDVIGRTDCSSVVITVNGSRVETPVERGGERFQAEVPLEAGRNEIVARCPNQGGAVSDPLLFDMRLTAAAIPRADIESSTRDRPSWVDRAIVYAPVPELWGRKGAVSVRGRLPYLKQLGVNVIWLWPPVSRRAPGEEYAVTDYFRIDESWGTRRDLQELISAAHELGMKVIVDFVPNHMAARSPYLRDSVTFGRNSAYWDFFDRNARGRPTHYFDWSHLHNLNFDNEEIRNMIIEASRHWVEEMNVDGFRMDVAWGVKRRYPAFWPELSRAIEHIDPQVTLLAEASAREPYYFDSGFDVAYDWTRELGRWAWAKAFETPARTGDLLRRALAASLRNNGEVLRFINNNDTGKRFIDRYGLEFTKLAATLQFTAPGVPAMFAGDEIGASYEPYTDIDLIPWEDHHGLRPFYKKLIHVRRDLPAFRSDRMVLLETGDPRTLAYIRGTTKRAPVLVVLNFGDATNVRVAGGGLRRMPDQMTDLLSDAVVGLERVGRASFDIPVGPRSGLVLVP